jgi:hypothetical protein
MDYKVMLTNKYLREINAKFYLCKKMNDGNDKSDIGKMDGGVTAFQTGRCRWPVNWV